MRGRERDANWSTSPSINRIFTVGRLDVTWA